MSNQLWGPWRIEELANRHGQPVRFHLNDRALALLHSIDRELWAGELCPSDGLAGAWKSRVERIEAVASASLDRMSSRPATAGPVPGRPAHGYAAAAEAEPEAIGVLRALEALRGWRDRSLNPEAIVELHGLIVGKAAAQGAPEPAAGSPASLVRLQLDALCRFAEPQGKDSETFIHPVVRAIVVHFWILHGRPFTEGNGRVARAVFLWLMRKQDYSLFEQISLSATLARRPESYVQSLGAGDDGDLLPFILAQLEAIADSVQTARSEARQRREEMAAVSRQLAPSAALNARQLLLLAHAGRHPEARYTIDGHRQRHQIVFQTARDDLFALVRQGWLGQQKEGRINVFYPVRPGRQRRGRPAPTPEASQVPETPFPIHLL